MNILQNVLENYLNILSIQRSNNFDEKFRIKELYVRLGDIDGSNRGLNNSLGRDSLSLLISLGLFLVIFLNSCNKSFSTWRLSKMFNSNVESLRDNSVSNLLVNNNSDWSWIDIEYCSSSTVIVFVWHSFMNWAVNDNINVITNSVCCESPRDVDGSNLLESLLELVSSLASLTVAMSHDWSLVNYINILLIFLGNSYSNDIFLLFFLLFLFFIFKIFIISWFTFFILLIWLIIIICLQIFILSLFLFYAFILAFTIKTLIIFHFLF